MTKKEIRKFYREKRMALTAVEQSKLDDLLLIQFQQAVIPFAETLFTYWPMEQLKEPNTNLFTAFMEFRNPELKVAFPRILPDGSGMEAVYTDDHTEFNKSDFGVYEPVTGERADPLSLDIIFVPLLAVDRNGFRIGYGKGYYDRYLPSCNPDCLKIGFSYFEPMDEIPEKHEFDVPLNLCMTPQSIYVF
jgi:5-formyltetrahydrofolate cyclo-ligase